MQSDVAMPKERVPPADPANASPVSRGLWIALVLCLVGVSCLQLKALSHPLLWQDEGETAMFGQRVLEHGVPLVDDGRNVVYGMGVPLRHGTKESSGVYIGSLWGQYYFAAIGVWLADGVSDLHDRTARVRLPFALAGAAGLAVLYLAIAGALPPLRRARLTAAVAFLIGLAASTSLLLHLREVRYYALVVLLVGPLAWTQLGAGRIGAGRRLAQGVLLFACFNVFYPAAVALAAWLAGEALLDARRHRRAGAPVARPLASALAPIAAAALALIPVVAYFEVLALSRVFTERYAFGAADYLANLRALAHYLLRYEWLGAVFVVRVALLVARRLGALAPEPPGARARTNANALLRLCAIWALIGARNPIFFERYFVPLSPVLLSIGLLDAGRLWGGLPAGRARAVCAAGLAALVVGTLALKRDELVGYAVQLHEPYRGPLDHVIPYLAERYERPSELTIATNYEAEPYMFYLGSRVVGRFHSDAPEDIARERATRVEIVVPRTLHPKHLADLRGYLEPGAFERRGFPVRDMPYNNIPELDAGRVLERTHLFRSPVAAAGEPRFSIQERIRD